MNSLLMGNNVAVSGARPWVAAGGASCCFAGLRSLSKQVRPRALSPPPPPAFVPTDGSCSSTAALPTFKASRPRKTGDFIEREKSSMLGADNADVPLNLPASCGANEHLFEEADAHTVTEKVAEMIYSYVMEGDSELSAVPQGVRGKEFHESRFFLEKNQSSLCFSWLHSPPTPPPATQEAVYQLIDDMATPLYFCKQVVVLAAVYIDRLLEETSTAVLNSNTWRPILIVTLLTASKVWEDVHPWNADFEACLREESGIIFQPRALYRLESLFLKLVRWRVFVDGKMYAAYFFALMSEKSDRARPLRIKSENFDTIIEDEPFHFHRDASCFSVRSFCSVNAACDVPSPTLATKSHGSTPACTPPASPSWRRDLLSREALVAQLRQNVLVSGDSCTSSQLKSKRSAWKLDAKNPHIGALRHAPRARAPSRHLPQSQELLFSNSLANSCACDFGPPTLRCRQDQWASANTISGATGKQLASELRKYLDNHDSPGAPAASTTTTTCSSPRLPGDQPQNDHSSRRCAPTSTGTVAGSLSSLDFGFGP